MEVRTLVAHVGDGNRFTLANGSGGFSDQSSVHDDAVAGVQILESKFVLGWHSRLNFVGLPLENNFVARVQAAQRYRDIILGSDF